MKIIFFLLLGMGLYKTVMAKEEQMISNLRLVGVIVDNQNVLEKSILVLKDISSNRTITIMGQAPILSSDYVFKGLFRDHILVGNGHQRKRINYIERQNNSGTIADVNSLDQLDASSIVARTNLAWEKLEQQAERLGLEMLKASEKVEGQQPSDCDQECNENEERSRESEDLQESDANENIWGATLEANDQVEEAE